MLKNTSTSYGLIAKFLHWGSALIILGLLSLGFYMTQMDFSPFKLELYGLHKSFGILILMLVGLRIAWKFTNARPKHLETHQVWEICLAKAAHIFLYGAMIAMPLSGWLMSSAGGFPAGFFGVFELPVLSGKDEALFDFFMSIHGILALIIIGVVGLHVAGAFKHHFIDGDETLRRISSRSVGFWRGALLALIVGAFISIPVYFVGQRYLGPEEEHSHEAHAEVVDSPVITEIQKSKAIWAINPDTSSIKFEAMQYGQPFSGSFAFDGKIMFDPDDLTHSGADIVIDIASINTGSDDRDKQARSNEWFDVDLFPQARFIATSFTALGANRYLATGDLTLRDVTIVIDFPFTLEISKGEGDQAMARMTGELSLPRLDFGVGQGQWSTTETIGNEVKIMIFVEALQNETMKH